LRYIKYETGLEEIDGIIEEEAIREVNKRLFIHLQ